METFQVYKPSAIQKIIYGFALAVTLGATVLLLYAVFSGKFTIDEDGKQPITTGFLVLAALLLFFGFLFFKHIGKPVFRLFPDGVQIGGGNIIPYETISDIFLFHSGKHKFREYNNLAFRISENDDWHVISADYSGKLDVFLEKYFAPRVRFLEKEMQNGKTATFFYLKKKLINAFGIGPKSFLKKLQTDTIRIGANTISIGNQTLNYANLLPLYMNGKNFEIKTPDGTVIAAFKYTEVMSFDVFREIYNRKTQKS